MITKNNLPRHELIGLYGEVVNSTDKTQIGIKGKIVDETKNMLVIVHNGVIKKLPKKNITLKFRINASEEVILNCKKIIYRPEDRIKRVRTYGKKIRKNT